MISSCFSFGSLSDSPFFAMRIERSCLFMFIIIHKLNRLRVDDYILRSAIIGS